MKKLFSISLIIFTVTVNAQTVKADGKTDDLAALQLAAKAGNIVLPSGVIRITDTWVIGDQFYSPEMLFDKDIKGSDANKYHNAQYTRNIDVIGNRTTIFLDNPDTTKPVISYNAQGLKEGFPATISGLKLIGKGYGITAAFIKNLTLNNIIFSGLKEGLVLNNCNFINATNLRFDNCTRAEYDIRCHRASFNNIVLAFCKKGFEIRSNNVLINGYYASFCNTGLHVAAGNNEFHSIYLESTLPGNGQLIIGDSTGVTVDGNEFNTTVISASNPLNRGIVFMPNVGIVSFRGGGAQSTLFSVLGKPTVIASNFKALLPTSILKQ